MLFLSAPLQGFTQAPWRSFHAAAFPGDVDAYFTPFLRLESGLPRRRDLHDIASPLNNGIPLVAQVIARDAEEFALLTDAAAEAGATRIDLNAGCPYPMLTRRGRGSALIENPDALAAISTEMQSRPHLRFSMKMRLGLDNPDAWLSSLPAIESMPLDLLTVHPRTARQMYSGELHTAMFARLLESTRHPVVFNGEIREPAHAVGLANEYPALAGIMVGRGLLLRPTLASEVRSGREASPDEIRRAIIDIHLKLFHHFESTLCGPAQILSKIKPYIDYLPENLFARKAIKTLRKSSRPEAYLAALRAL